MLGNQTAQEAINECSKNMAKAKLLLVEYSTFLNQMAKTWNQTIDVTKLEDAIFLVDISLYKLTA